MARENIPSLLNEVREIVDSPRNQALYELWPEEISRQAYADFGPFYYWFPTPVNKDGRIPYTLACFRHTYTKYDL